MINKKENGSMGIPPPSQITSHAVVSMQNEIKKGYDKSMMVRSSSDGKFVPINHNKNSQNKGKSSSK